jgi:hypothetical protein
MPVGDLGLDRVVGDDFALFHVDQQHAARLKPPLLDDLLFRYRQHAGFRRHDDEIIVGDDIAGRTQTVAVERRADLAAIGEGNRCRAIPWFHQGSMIFVERLAVVRHQLVARPCLGNEHHHRMGERVAALEQEFQRVVETGRIGLAFIGNRPELRDVIAEEFAVDRGLTRRHPVDVAAQGVDFTIVRNHAVGMRQLPRREGVGREALMHQRHRADETRILQVLVIGTDLIGEEHALVDDGARRHGHDVEVALLAAILLIDAVGNHLAQDKQPAFEILIGFDVGVAPDEHLAVERFRRRDMRRLGQGRIVDGNIAEADQRLTFRGDDFRDDGFDMGALFGILRHEQITDGVMIDRRQLDTLFGPFRAEKRIGNLHEHACAIAHQRVGADGTAMRQVFEHEQPVFNDLVRLDALHMRDEADAAGVMFVARVVQALSGGNAGRFIGFDRTVLYGLSKFSRYRWRQIRHRQSLQMGPLGRSIPRGTE